MYALGLVARLWPFFDGPLGFLQRFPTEDGYFMLTIGRNLAIGKGMSTAAGTIPTNGTQPLMALVWALCFAAVDGARSTGVWWVLWIELALSILTAYALWRLGLLLLRERRLGRSTALLASALWFASPLVVPHTMNCLESGAYALAVIGVAHALLRLECLPPERPHLGAAAAFGGLLGLAFWTRNDAVFLVAAACATHLTGALQTPRDHVRPRMWRCAVFGSVSVLVASPWLAYNYFGFGSIVPVSGRAEQLTIEAGANVVTTLTSLLEYATMVLPIPQALQNDPRLAVGAALGLGALGWLSLRELPALRPKERVLAMLVLAFAAQLVVYYGLYFGARWFVQRYMFPLSPFFALLLCALVLRAMQRSAWLRRPRAAPLLAAATLCLLAGLHVRAAIAHRHHSHFQVVRWVQAHVSPKVWVGAIQTGTLGFYHDRTLNFDGKVNPQAYRALVAHRRPEYVVDSKVQYLVDWCGIADWLDDETIRDHFALVLDDEHAQLAVLGRRSTADTSKTADAR